jgi:cytochrome o ubiquinol oxidase subunit 1
LSWDAVPWHEPVAMGGVFMMVMGALVVLGGVTYFKKWGYLYREWFTSVDHKRLGIMYIILALIMLLRGFADALMMRTQQAIAAGGHNGFLVPEHYNQVFTAHGVIMIFFMAMPFMVGLMNIVVPLQIGARDVAFPFVNSFSFWLTAAGAILVNASLAIGEFGRTGWLAYPPLSELAYSPGVGVDYYIWALQISGLGTLLTGVNFFVTIVRMRAPGMSWMRLPVFTWTALCTNMLIIMAFPILTVTLALLSADRYLGMHFFTNDGGGNAMMYVNLIWAWGHPEVYILILPAFGIFSEITSTFSSKKLFGYTSMVWATVGITILSYIVWLHHFFTMGSGADVNAFFGISTMLISIPTGVKIFNWMFTMYRGRIRFATPMLWTIGFIITFVIGGMTGVMLAVPGADFLLHNSVFLIAHFHNVIIGGVLFGYVAGMVYWFPKSFGFRLHEGLGKVSFWCWLIGFWVAFTPIYILGFDGMTRRMQHYENTAWQPYLIVAALGALIIAAGIGAMILQIVVSVIQRDKLRDVTGDPWGGRTLEWLTASPPPFYNFAQTPVVHTLDALAEMKLQGDPYKRPHHYDEIHMPRNTGAGFIMGLLSAVLGFALIWHIWWLAIAGFVGMIVAFIVRSMDQDVDYYVPAKEVERIENARHLAMANQG